MTLITAKTLGDEAQATAELLKALQDSIAGLRRTAQTLRDQLAEGVTDGLANGARELQGADQLARNCMKTEVALAEICNRNAGIVRGGYALDLDVARLEVGCRLGRLRKCGRS